MNTRRLIAVVAGVAIAAAALPPAQAQEFELPGRPKYLRASAVPSHTTVAPAQRFHVAVELDIDEGWVYYSPTPGETVKPAGITVEANGFEAGRILWPADQPYETDLGGGRKLVNHVYKKRVVVYVPLAVPEDASPGERSITITASGQVCGRFCVDVEAAASVAVAVGRQPGANSAWAGALADGLDSAVPAEKLPSLRPSAGARGPAAPAAPAGVAELTVLAGLALAFLAGLILNVMPCVLPVIPLRVLSLAQMAGQRRRRLITLGLAFAAGVMLFFIGLGAVNVAVRLIGRHAFSLSGLFQFRPVRIALAMVLVALAANLFGLFNVVVPGRLAAIGQGPNAKAGGHLSSVAMGLMLAVLATPCSFAILAKALAWAQVVPLWLGTAAILTIGLGMAAPHAALVAFPGLIEALPRPGRWMELLKQSMGFLLLPVAVWLIFAGSADTYPGWVVGYGIVLAACLWVWGTWVRPGAPRRRKLALRGVAVALAVSAGVFMLRPARPPAVRFEAFDADGIARLHRDGRLVLVKFTSATCLSCIWLDRTVYSDPALAAEIERRDIAAFKADTTDAGSPASKMLRERFGGAPPLTVLLPPGRGKPIRLDGKFATSDLMAAFEKANGR